MSAWEQVRKHIDEQSVRAVARVVGELDEAERRAVAKELPRHITALRAGREPWERLDEYAPALRAAGAGTLSGAAAVASWLNRRELNSRWWDHDDTDLLLTVLEDRPAEWLEDLARRLTLRLRGPRHSGADLVLALLAETGIEPPEHDPLVVAWATEAPPRSGDPLLPYLLPRIFEADGVGAALRGNASWLRTLPTLADRGAVDRKMLLDGCVRRFLRGGAAPDLRFFVGLHRLLEASDPAARKREIAERARDYLRLLPAAPGPVAAHALDLLRELDGLDAADVAEALEGVLFRQEAGLVRTGLTWLEEIVRRAPETADEYAAALAQAFGSQSYSVQGRAVRVALKLPALSPDADAVIRDGVGLLPADLGAQLATRFGGKVAEPDANPAPPILVAPPAEELPDLHRTVTTVGGLVRLIEEPAETWAEAEEFMAAFVRLAHGDGFGAALGSRRRVNYVPYLSGLSRWRAALEWQIAAVELMAGPAPGLRDWPNRLPSPHEVSPMHLLLLSRWAELLAAVERGAFPPVLLATPTRPTGQLDPLVLVERLEAHEAAGFEPGSADFQQALLRLPRTVDAVAADRAAALTSPRGRLAAKWLAEGGFPDPEYAVERFPGGQPRITSHARPTRLPLIDAIFGDPRGDVHDRYQGDWPHMLPSHPVVVAAHLASRLRHPGSWAFRRSAAAIRGDGPFGEVVTAVVAAGLAERTNGPARDAVATMAARGDLPAVALGRAIGGLARDGKITLNRVAGALGEVAESGGYVPVWLTVAAALAVLDPDAAAVPGQVKLVALGLRTARWSGARGAIPAVAELAARTGSTKLVREARLLHAHLTRSAG